MRALFTEHKMPSGQLCFYRGKDHSYWRGIEPKKANDPDGDWKGCERLQGISTVSGGLDFDPEPLMKWAAKTQLEGVVELWHSQSPLMDVGAATRFLDNAETMWSRLEREGLTYMDIRDQAAKRGTNVHEHALHALAKGAPVPSYEDLSEEERGYAKGVVKFWLERAPEPLHAEQVVMDLDLGIAGRFDLRCVMDGSIVLLDCKTSGFIPLKHHVQLAGYDWCCGVSGLGFNDRLLILQVDPEGDYELIPVRANREDFRCAVDSYKRSRRIVKEAAADRKERQLAFS